MANRGFTTADLGNFILKICFYVCAMDLSGQTVSASNVSTLKIGSRALHDSFDSPKCIQPGFSYRVCVVFKWLWPICIIVQFIINITVTTQVSFIPNLYSYTLEFCDDHLWNRFGLFFFFGVAWTWWTEFKTSLHTPQCYCRNCNKSCVHSLLITHNRLLILITAPSIRKTVSLRDDVIVV